MKVVSIKEKRQISSEESRFPELLPLHVLCDIATALECSLDYLCGNLYVFSVPGLNDEEDK